MNKIIKYEEYGEIFIISPTYGEFAIRIDLDDIERCENYKWGINRFVGNKGKYGNFYVSNSKIGLLHRFITTAPKGKVVDHINGDTLDNRKDNLRICESRENSQNQKDRINNKSGHKGVCRYKRLNMWMAYIMIDKKHKTLGYFHNIEDAIRERKKAEEQYFGEFSRQFSK